MDTWKRLGTMRDLAQQSRADRHTVFDDDTPYLLDSTLEALASFIGNLMENTTRSQGWRFLKIGRRIERGLSISFLLRSAYQDAKPNDETLLSKLLEWADSSITYRRRYLNTLTDTNALDVLCFDNTNPRSLTFQTEQLRSLLNALPHAQNAQRHPIDQTALQLYSRVGLGDPETLTVGTKGRPAPLPKFLLAACDDLLKLAQRLEQTYFAHTTPATAPKSKSIIG